MSRLVVVVLILSLGSASGAYAGETLLGVAARVARETAPNQAAEGAKSAANARERAVRGFALATAPGQFRSATMMQEPAVSSSGMRKRTKVLIYLAATVGVVGSWYIIDHKVEDNTPSTLGTRRD